MKGFIRLLPTSLTGQMVAVVAIALIGSVMISVLVLGSAYNRVVVGVKQNAIVQRVVTMVDLLEVSPEELHQSIVRAANSRNERVRIDPRSAVKRHTPSSSEKRLLTQLETLLSSEYKNRVNLLLKRKEARKPKHVNHDWQDKQVSPMPDKFRQKPPERFQEKGYWRRPPLEVMKVSVQLNNGQWLNVISEAPRLPSLLVGQTLLFLTLSLLFVILAVIFMLRRIVRPMKKLASAANSLGKGEQVEPLEVSGPKDVQDTVQAFNVMNERMQKFIADRTRTLAALSHDLRTPLTSMRLRIELLPDSTDKEQLLSRLEEMQQMSDATLSFLREASDKEESRRVDLNALISSLCDDMTDLGLSVNYEETTNLVVQCRLVSLKRALRNLFENGVKYGDQIDVSMEEKQGSVHILIQDHGFGIPESKMEQMFEPFTRIEASRNRDSGGIGLGLAIARNNIRSHGGDIHMKNNDTGLLITVELPLK